MYIPFSEKQNTVQESRREAPLVIPTESSSNPKKGAALKGASSEESSLSFRKCAESKGASEAGALARPSKWVMLRRVRKALMGSTTPKGGEWRVLSCHHAVLGDNVAVYRSVTNRGSGSLRGLMVCGSVWNCPVCNSRITEQRKVEINKAHEAHVVAGGECQMVTLTNPHTRMDKLSDTVRLQGLALEKLRSGGAYKKLRESYGCVGTIRTLEATWGEANGWHPHVHDLWFTDKLSEERKYQLRVDVYTLWSKACVKVGLPCPSFEHGVDVRTAFSPAEYFLKFDRPHKWSAGSELTKANSKTGTPGRYTPYDLLNIGRDDLFREFCTVFFGKAQLYWSTGLKKRFGIEEVSNEQAAEQEDIHNENTGELVAYISKPLWKLIRSHKEELREAIIQSAVSSGLEGLLLLLPVFGLPVSLRGQTLHPS